MQFDRYLLAQLMRTTLSVAVTLIGIVWLFQTIRILEIVVNRGAPITDFFVMSVTVVPLWLTIALPISAFVAVTWVFQRALADRELLVMQASGRSSFQLARAPLALGAIMTLFLILNSVVFLPLSFGIYKDVQFRLRTSIPSVMLQDNVFIDVVNGMTMLIGKKLDSGLAQDVFIHDERNEGKIITMTAKVGKFVEKDNKPVVILRDGQRVELDPNGDSGATLSFESHTVSIVPKGKQQSARMPIDMNEDSISNLLDPSKSPSANYFNQRRAEGHYRIVSPFLSLLLILIATCSVLLGQIRRDTWPRRTLINVGGAVLAISLLVSSRSLATTTPSAVPLIYLSMMLPSLIFTCLLAFPQLGRLLSTSLRVRRVA